MPQSKILIDTNSYIRLAQTIKPLLFQHFGDENYCLYVLEETHQELMAQRLERTFSWINEDEYFENRQNFPNIGRKHKADLKQNFDYMWEDAQEVFKGPSPTDVIYLATALALDIPVVTDDKKMISLGLDYEVKVMTTLELLKLMLDSKHIEMSTINSLVRYWIAFNDKPGNLFDDYKRLFDIDLIVDPI